MKLFNKIHCIALRNSDIIVNIIMFFAINTTNTHEATSLQSLCIRIGRQSHFPPNLRQSQPVDSSRAKLLFQDAISVHVYLLITIIILSTESHSYHLPIYLIVCIIYGDSVVVLETAANIPLWSAARRRRRSSFFPLIQSTSFQSNGQSVVPPAPPRTDAKRLTDIPELIAVEHVY